jgi:hypothetical protein
MWPCSRTESSVLTWLLTIRSQWYDYLVTWITCDMQITNCAHFPAKLEPCEMDKYAFTIR